MNTPLQENPLDKEEFFVKKFIELQQANARMYKIFLDLYSNEECKKIIDSKMPEDFLEFVRKNLV